MGIDVCVVVHWGFVSCAFGGAIQEALLVAHGLVDHERGADLLHAMAYDAGGAPGP